MIDEDDPVVVVTSYQIFEIPPNQGKNCIVAFTTETSHIAVLWSLLCLITVSVRGDFFLVLRSSFSA